MSESKHTPGPWMATMANMITTANAHMELATVWANPSRVHVPEEEAEANARLMAAAPDLLGSIVSLVDILDDYINARGDIDLDSLTLQPARAAIAKAKGETQ